MSRLGIGAEPAEERCSSDDTRWNCSQGLVWVILKDQLNTHTEQGVPHYEEHRKVLHMAQKLPQEER